MFSEALAINCALSVDTFASCFAYGASKIKIKASINILLNLICTGIFSLAFLAGTLLSGIIDDNIEKYVSFTILLTVGTVKFFSEILKMWILSSENKRRSVGFKMFGIGFILTVAANCTKADVNCDKLLSAKEATVLALALSIDSVGVGLSAGVSGLSFFITAPLCFLIGFAAALLGDVLGRKIASKTKFNLSPLSGLILICLAVSKLF